MSVASFFNFQSSWAVPLMISWVGLGRLVLLFDLFMWARRGKFVFARRGNLGFAFEKLLVAQQRRIAAAFPPIQFSI